MLILANPLDITHRLLTPRITVFEILVNELLRQQGEYLLDVSPAVRIEVLFPRQPLGIMQVATPNVIGRQGQPGAVRFFHLVRKALIPELRQVLGTPENALLGIQPVIHAHFFCRIQRQHHDPPDPGRAAGLPLIIGAANRSHYDHQKNNTPDSVHTPIQKKDNKTVFALNTVKTWLEYEGCYKAPYPGVALQRQHKPECTNNWYCEGGAMQKNTSITLGDHFDAFIAEQIESGRYSSTSEVVRAALRLLEDSETRLNTLRTALKEGEDSGFADYSYESFIEEMDNDNQPKEP